MRFVLGDGLRGNAAVRCTSGADALLFSTIVQLALSYQTSRLGDTKPELARILGDLRLNRQEERLDFELAIRETDFVTLLEKNSFTLNF